MSTQGTVNEVHGHATFWMVRVEHINFNYAEPHSGHNEEKIWVDDHNNRRHIPIDIVETGKTKWWPNQQFSFFLRLSEVNASVSCAYARGVPKEPQLEF